MITAQAFFHVMAEISAGGCQLVATQVSAGRQINWTDHLTF
jgi:hypothetical protein